MSWSSFDVLLQQKKESFLEEFLVQQILVAPTEVVFTRGTVFSVRSFVRLQPTREPSLRIVPRPRVPTGVTGD